MVKAKWMSLGLIAMVSGMSASAMDNTPKSSPPLISQQPCLDPLTCPFDDAGAPSYGDPGGLLQGSPTEPVGPALCERIRRAVAANDFDSVRVTACKYPESTASGRIGKRRFTVIVNTATSEIIAIRALK